MLEPLPPRSQVVLSMMRPRRESVPGPVNPCPKNSPYRNQKLRDAAKDEIRLSKKVAQFWSRVDIRGDAECWEWVGGLYSNGYGSLYGGSKLGMKNGLLAHRFSYIINIGEIPEGMVVCHKCDNRKCVNPSHLFLGTQAENMEDMRSKNRRNDCRGEAHRLAKLTEEDIVFILNSGLKVGTLAEMFAVSKPTILSIRWGDTWAHVAPHIRRSPRVRPWRKRTPNPERLQAVAGLRCVACKRLGVAQKSHTEVHHIRRMPGGRLYGRGIKAHDEETIPLCGEHHWNGVNSKWTHRGFEAAFGNERDLLEQTNAMLEGSEEE